MAVEPWISGKKCDRLKVDSSGTHFLVTRGTFPMGNVSSCWLGSCSGLCFESFQPGSSVQFGWLRGIGHFAFFKHRNSVLHHLENIIKQQMMVYPMSTKRITRKWLPDATINATMVAFLLHLLGFSQSFIHFWWSQIGWIMSKYCQKNDNNGQHLVKNKRVIIMNDNGVKPETAKNPLTNTPLWSPLEHDHSRGNWDEAWGFSHFLLRTSNATNGQLKIDCVFLVRAFSDIQHIYHLI